MKRLYLTFCLLLSAPLLRAEKIHFSDQIQPIFVKNCTACHGGVKAAGGISLIYKETALAVGDSEKPCIVPGSPETSELVRRIKLAPDDEDVMPKADHGHKLSGEEIKLIEQWIREGAEWTGHWSFSPLRAREKKSIDDFIQEKREEQNLSPSDPATKEELLRRVTLDLTGISPTLAELDAFSADQSPRAYEKVVDRLLASTAYGEKWASMWLDLARYADSEGMGHDFSRQVFPFRNWVIKALNEDMPFDQFTIKQLAGDLLPERVLDDLIATGFHRMTAQNSEGGTDDEEFRVQAVMDRTATTWNVWQGVTMECVQCHDHPYDPIEHKDYFTTMAFFNNTEDRDYGDLPKLTIPWDSKRNPEVIDAYNKREETVKARDAFSKSLYENTQWDEIAVTELNSGAKQMELERVEGELGQEFHASGTPTSTHHNVYFKPKEDLPITAIRVKVYPKDIKKAASAGESGFALRLELFKNIQGKPREEARFAQVHVEEGHDDEFPYRLIDKKDKQGWGVVSKQFHPVWMVVTLVEPLKIDPATETLHLWMPHFRVGNQGSVSMITRRFTIHTTSDEKWSSPVNVEQHRKNTQAFQSHHGAYTKYKGAETLVMKERSSNRRRETRLFQRGNWMVRGDLYAPDTPKSFPPLQRTHDSPTYATRLDLARWLVSTENPLTARVWVNRLWHQLFGLGLVETMEDFGAAGTPPTHPRLLDRLAHDFMHTHGWKTKPMIKEIVMSSTYRQTALTTAEKRTRDPLNQWLSYGPRQRLSAEMIRDSALSISGLYTPQLYGGIVRPPIPEGVWNPFHAKDVWNTPEKGEANRYRRAIYTYVKREIPYPQNEVFDAPNRQFCTQRRINSNTPIQALMMMNDQVFLECAHELAKKMATWRDLTFDEKIKKAYTLITTAELSAHDLEALKQTHQELKTQYNQIPEEAQKLASTPEEAATTILCSIMLNLDHFLTR